ncbi:MAG: enolase C-terminal domain-like protein [Anaerolineae bacterium]
MKIAEVMTAVVDMPFYKEFHISGGGSPGATHVLVKIISGEGIEGIGEAAPLTTYSEESYGTVDHVIRDFLRPALLGQDPLDREVIEERMEEAIPGHHMAKAAVDIALYDLVGKSLGLPVFKLLGGLYRDKIPQAWSIGIADSQTMAQEAKHFVEIGYKAIKIKIGRDPEEDLEHLSAVRKAIGPGVKLRVDANQGYRSGEALPVLRRMEQFDLEYIEQPLPRWDVEGLRALAAALDTPILADESVFTPQDVITLVRRQAADVINIKVAKCGLSNGKRIAAIAEAAGLRCMVGSMIELGPGTAAGVHFAAATRNVTHACELVGPLLFKDDVLEEKIFSTQPVGGYWQVSHEPGLGIRLRKDIDRLFTAPG